MAKEDNRRWSRVVKTVSTFPPQGLFTKDAKTIARTMASKKVSPKGIGSGIRMVQFFINRAGKNLSLERREELEKAKQILQQKGGTMIRKLKSGQYRLYSRKFNPKTGKRHNLGTFDTREEAGADAADR